MQKTIIGTILAALGAANNLLIAKSFTVRIEDDTDIVSSPSVAVFTNPHEMERYIMRKRLPVTLLALIPFGLVSAAALAETCGNYPLTQDQNRYLISQVPDIAIPEGDVPMVQRCDIDGNDVVDINDIRAITKHRNQPAAHPDDPMDYDRNGVVTVRDARGCQRACTLRRCAVPRDYPEQMQGGVSEPGQCFQSDDFDDDGTQDIMGIYQYTGNATRGNNWALQLVILTQDSAGNVRHVTFPYTGQVAPRSGDLQQHLSIQPAGEVDLNPRTITIPGPGVVSYRDGEPKTIYYYANGRLNRAFYGIDD